MTELLLMHLQRRNQQIGVAGPLVVEPGVSDDLLLRLLDLDILPNSVGLPAFPLRIISVSG